MTRHMHSELERLPLVSVVIPCFNYGAYLEEAVESVLASTYPRLEILVVDDGSTDPATLDLLDRLDKPHTRVIRQQNKRLPGARNTGIREARGTYILPLDADDLIAPTFIEKAVWILETQPEVGFVTVWVRLFGDENYTWRPAPFNLLHWMFENLSAATALFRKQAWEGVGGYDEAMIEGYEDWDFWLKLAKRQWKGFQIPEPLLLYRRHGVTMLHESRTRHERLLGQLRSNHPDLFNPRAIAALKQVWGPPPLPIPPELDAEPLTVKKGVKRLLKAAIPPGMRQRLTASYRRWRHGLKQRAASLHATVPAAPPRDRLAHLCVPASRSSTEKLNLLLVVPWLEIGGADKVNLDLVAGLDPERYAVTIVTTLDSAHPWWDRFHAVTSDLFHLPTFGSTSDQMRDTLLHLVRTRRIDLVQVSQSAAGFELLAALKETFPDLPVVTLLHMYVPTDSWDYVRSAHQQDRYVDRHVAITQGLKEAMVERLGFDPAKVTVIDNGVDESAFTPAGADRALASSLGLSDGKKVVTFIGRMADQKQPLRFLEVARCLTLADYYDDYRFLMVGDGPQLEEVREAVQRYGLQDQVILAGARRDISELLRLSHVVVAPSLYEGLPILGLEAMAAEVPVVASRVVGWQDLITHGHDGFLHEVYDTVEMARQVERLLQDESLRGQVGRNARLTVERQYTLERFVTRYDQLYHELLGRTGASPLRQQAT